MQTFTGIEYLKIDVAASFGLDKMDWQDRITWFDAHESELERLLPAAEEPVLFHAGVQAYRTAIQGKPIGYPISLDAASSGLQLLACLSGCRKSASLCGVVPTGHREDAYTNIYKIMKEILTSGDLSLQPGDTTAIAGSGISRADCKRAIMTSLYSSQAIPKEVFGEGDQLQVFYQTMATEAPGAWELNFALQGLWQPYARSHDWVLPDNFHVHVPVTDKITRFVQFQNRPEAVELKVNQGTREGRSISPNIIHSIDGMVVREMHRRCSYDPGRIQAVRAVCDHPRGDRFTGRDRPEDLMVEKLWQHYRESGFLSARILDYLDLRNIGMIDHETIRRLLDTLPEKPFPVISIHDCFRVHPNQGNDLRRTYNRILAEIAGSNLMAFIASQVMGHPVTVNKLDDIAGEVLETDYALC